MESTTSNTPVSHWPCVTSHFKSCPFHLSEVSAAVGCSVLHKFQQTSSKFDLLPTHLLLRPHNILSQGPQWMQMCKHQQATFSWGLYKLNLEVLGFWWIPCRVKPWQGEKEQEITSSLSHLTEPSWTDFLESSTQYLEISHIWWLPFPPSLPHSLCSLLLPPWKQYNMLP